jgi:hypothetical protein
MAGPAEKGEEKKKKNHPPDSYRPPRAFPSRNEISLIGGRRTAALNSRENIFSAGAAYVSAGTPFQFPRGSRPPLHEGKYLPETDTTCGKQYAPGGSQ